MENLSEQEVGREGRERSTTKGWIQTIKKATQEMKKGLCSVVTMCQAEQSSSEEEDFPPMEHRNGKERKEAIVEVNRMEEGFLEGEFNRKEEHLDEMGNSDMEETGSPREVEIQRIDKNMEMITKIGKENAECISGVIEFIGSLVKVVNDSAHVNDTAYTPILLLITMKETYSPGSMEDKWAEGMSYISGPKERASPSNPDLHSDVIEYIVTEGLDPTICISYWISHCKPLEKAYISLYDAVLGSLYSKKKEGTKIEKNMLFYNLVLKTIRTYISYKLAELNDPVEEESEESRFFIDAIESLLKRESVKKYINIDRTSPEINKDFQKIYREFLAETPKDYTDCKPTVSQENKSQTPEEEPTASRIDASSLSTMEKDMEVSSASSKAAEEMKKFFINTPEATQQKSTCTEDKSKEEKISSKTKTISRESHLKNRKEKSTKERSTRNSQEKAKIEERQTKRG